MTPAHGTRRVLSAGRSIQPRRASAFRQGRIVGGMLSRERSLAEGFESVRVNGGDAGATARRGGG